MEQERTGKTRRQQAIELPLATLQSMTIGQLQSVAQALGCGPRQERREMLKAIVKRQKEWRK